MTDHKPEKSLVQILVDAAKLAPGMNGVRHLWGEVATTDDEWRDTETDAEFRKRAVDQYRHQSPSCSCEYLEYELAKASPCGVSQEQLHALLAERWLRQLRPPGLWARLAWVVRLAWIAWRG